MASPICLGTGADCWLMLGVVWDNGDDGSHVIGRLAWVIHMVVATEIPGPAREDKPHSASTFQVSFGITFTIVPLAKPSHIVQCGVNMGGPPERHVYREV